MKHAVPRKPWHPEEVARRVERARGALLARTGTETRWSEIGRHLSWASATITQVRSGRRALRVEELGEIAELLECSPGWLAFAEGRMWRGNDGIAAIEPGVDRYTTGEDAEAATARELAAQEEARRAAVGRPRAVGEGRGGRASDAPARGSGRGTPGGRRRDR